MTNLLLNVPAAQKCVLSSIKKFDTYRNAFRWGGKKHRGATRVDRAEKPSHIVELKNNFLGVSRRSESLHFEASSFRLMTWWRSIHKVELETARHFCEQPTNFFAKKGR